MAEIPDLGVHCALTKCNQLDFVPFRCDLCFNFHCRNHRLPDQHGCSGQQSENKCCKKEEEEVKFLCSMSGCFQRERTRIQCQRCNRNFCMRHRICEDHDCIGLEKPSLLANKPKIELTRMGERKEEKEEAKKTNREKKLNAEQQARHDRVQILKLKARNPLKLPADQQLFLFANLAEGGNGGGDRRLVVVSRQWSLLKALWHIAVQLDLGDSDNFQAFRGAPPKAAAEEEENADNGDETGDEPLALGENVAKLLPNESDFILMRKNK